MNRELRTAIILQGGGALGAYECGVLEALYQARGKDFTPEVITGISIGAVNAAILAGAGIGALGDAWRTRFCCSKRCPTPPSRMCRRCRCTGNSSPPGNSSHRSFNNTWRCWE